MWRAIHKCYTVYWVPLCTEDCKSDGAARISLTTVTLFPTSSNVLQFLLLTRWINIWYALCRFFYSVAVFTQAYFCPWQYFLFSMVTVIEFNSPLTIAPCNKQLNPLFPSSIIKTYFQLGVQCRKSFWYFLYNLTLIITIIASSKILLSKTTIKTIY